MLVAPSPRPALALEGPFFLHVADAALAVVLDVLGEVDEVLDVLLCRDHTNKVSKTGLPQGGVSLAKVLGVCCETYISQVLHDVEILPRGLELVPALLDRFLADQVARDLRPLALGGIPLPLVSPRFSIVGGCRHHGSVVHQGELHAVPLLRTVAGVGFAVMLAVAVAGAVAVMDAFQFWSFAALTLEDDVIVVAAAVARDAPADEGVSQTEYARNQTIQGSCRKAYLRRISMRSLRSGSGSGEGVRRRGGGEGVRRRGGGEGDRRRGASGARSKP